MLLSGVVAVAQPALKLQVTIRDSAGKPVNGVRVDVMSASGWHSSANTDEQGSVTFSGLPAAEYLLSAAKDGFQTIEKQNVEIAAPDGVHIELTLVQAITHSESVEVSDTASRVEESTSVATKLPPEKAKELPSRPATVADVLPLTPGVVREPGGALILSGAAENRSALIVNSADVTDPATGQFGLTVPIDSVDVLNVYQTAYLAEYGRFTAGLVSVETKRGGDKWNWAINDPLPEFRIRSYQLRGLKTATPRLNFDGPLIPGKLYLSEGAEYEIKKTPIYTLPFPENQQKHQGVNTFSQLDWVASSTHLVTATMHFAPQRLDALNMDFFNPRPTTADAKTRNYTGTFFDRLTIHRGLLENRVSVTSFTASVWGRGTDELTIGPAGNTGNYFAEQDRAAFRVSGGSRYTFAPVEHYGTHNFKIGAYFAGSEHDGNVLERPIRVEDSTGTLLYRVTFPSRARKIDVSDLEKSMFAEDHWILNSRMSVDLGVRTESQQISGAFRVAPRLGLAWMPTATTAVRGGFGLFYDRVPLNVYAFNRYPDRIVTLYEPDGTVAAGPFRFLNTLGQNRVRFPFVNQRPIDGNFSPRSNIWSMQVEQSITRALKVRATYLQNSGDGLIVLSRVAPDPETKLGAYLLEGTGGSRYRQFDVMAQVKAGANREMFFSYARSRSRGDLNDFGRFLGTVPTAVIRENVYGTLSSDLPNRFLTWGVLQCTKTIQVAPVIEYRSGFPYADVDAFQRYSGIPNRHRYPTFLSVDSRFSKDVKVNAKYTARISISGFNLTNHFNPEAVHMNSADPVYGYFFGHRGRRFTADFDVIF